MNLHTECILIPCMVLLFLIPKTAPFSVNFGNIIPKDHSSKRCSHFRERGMMAVDCYGLELTEIPQNLRTDIELLHATHNRIRDLYNSSFERYPYLKYLYLDENMISYVETGTFDPLQDLEVIRLSLNALNRVPPGVLRLPKLRKIFLDGNRLIRGGGFEGAPPSETLESLTLANCHLEELPLLEMYSNLLELNVSGNDLQRILPQQLAPMCQLHWLDISRNPKLFDSYSGRRCDCHLLASWIAYTNIILQGSYRLNCTSDEHDLTHCGNITEATETYNTCISIVTAKAKVLQFRQTWNLVLIIFSAVILTVILLLLWFYRHNRRKNKKLSARRTEDLNG